MNDPAPNPANDRTAWAPRPSDCVRIDGRQCHVLDRGNGPPVVLLHGLGSVAREIALPLRPLSRRYRLIAPDRPGYGASTSLSRACLRPDEQAGWLRGVLRHGDARRPIIVAHSIASAVALRYALRYPDEVAGLVLIAPFCRPTRPAFLPLLRLSLLPVIGRFLRARIIPALANLLGPNRLAAAFAPNPVPKYLRAMPFRDFVTSDALKTMAAELMGFNPAMIASRAALPHLDVPTVVLAGGADTTADPERHAAWIARRLPEARLQILPGAGHMVQHARPNAVMRAVDEVAVAAR